MLIYCLGSRTLRMNSTIASSATKPRRRQQDRRTTGKDNHQGLLLLVWSTISVQKEGLFHESGTVQRACVDGYEWMIVSARRPPSRTNMWPSSAIAKVVRLAQESTNTLRQVGEGLWLRTEKERKRTKIDTIADPRVLFSLLRSATTTPSSRKSTGRLPVRLRTLGARRGHAQGRAYRSTGTD